MASLIEDLLNCTPETYLEHAVEHNRDMRRLITGAYSNACDRKEFDKALNYDSLYRLTEGIGWRKTIANGREKGYQFLEKHDMETKTATCFGVGLATLAFGPIGLLVGGLAALIGHDYFKSGKDAREKLKEKQLKRVYAWERKRSPEQRETRNPWNILGGVYDGF